MKNICQEDIRSLIQEWFCDCTTTTETALLYGELYCELQRGLEERMSTLEAGEESR